MLQFRIGQGQFCHALAVIERSGNAQRPHVVAEAAELMCLPRRHAAVGVKNDDAKMRHFIKCGSDRRAGIAGCGDNDRQRLLAAVVQTVHASGKETRTEILERGGGPVKKFENVVVACRQRSQRR